MGVPGEVLTEEGQHSGPGEPRHRAWKPECRKRARDPQFWSQSLVVKSLLGATLKQHTAQYLLEEGPGTPGRSGRAGPGQTFLEGPGEGQGPRRPGCLAGTACNSSSKLVPGDPPAPRPALQPGTGSGPLRAQSLFLST